MMTNLSGSRVVDIIKIFCTSTLILFSYQLTQYYPGDYSRFIFSALIFSALGDIALIFRTRRLLIVGMLFFAAAHIAFVTAFFQYSIDYLEFAVTLAIISLSLGRLLQWLGKNLPAKDKLSIIIYGCFLITMVSAALCVRTEGSVTILALGGSCFLVSDILVAGRKYSLFHVLPKKVKKESASVNDDSHLSERVLALLFYYVAQVTFLYSIISLKTNNPWLPE